MEPAAPRDLFQAAFECLMAADPGAKLALVEGLARDWFAGRLVVHGDAPAPVPVPVPGRPERPRLVSPRELPQRGLGTPAGRAALIHAVAHIEFNAINLACDAIYRFRAMPDDYYGDWISVTHDEARHFALLSERLGVLGHRYGDFDAHNGLWEMALRTGHDPLLRMALVPRVLEARGLDVTPGMIERLRAAGDEASVRVLELILREEVGHVAVGSRWFAWCCAGRGLEPEDLFRHILREHAPGIVRGPLNLPARRAAGFSEAELRALIAE
jgi:uncharacterized ferritin-like protein (DUF455 family)